MPSVLSILAASALATLAMGKPLPQAEPKKGFTVHQGIPKPALTGPQHLQNAYLKYNKPVPGNIKQAAANGQVTATPEQYDVEYLCPVSVGGQTLNLDFDTGSADLWVFSSELPASQSSGHSIYNPARSSTSKKLSGYTWNITYGDGSGASGDVYTDTVNVGGTTVTGQAVEAAQQISAQFQQDTDNDGLLGLAFSTINTVKPRQQKTFFDTAISEGVISSPLFTANLKKGKPGSYNFGYIDNTQYTGSIAYTPVDSSQGFWDFTASGYGVGSGAFKSGTYSGIADTGTTLLLLPDTIVNAYYAKVSGARYNSNQGGYVFSCSASLPNLVIGVGSARYTVPGSYINFAPLTTGSSTCFGGLQSSSGIGINIFGDIFLKAIFAVFDKSGPRLGFASKSL
uniref:Peptidase A1 domain-containing protein n=1 Tax=Araucaria cunninghamii TaxID=56994 RepID=A0A0D6R3Y9_ARACU